MELTERNKLKVLATLILILLVVSFIALGYSFGLEDGINKANVFWQDHMKDNCVENDIPSDNNQFMDYYEEQWKIVQKNLNLTG